MKVIGCGFFENSVGWYWCELVIFLLVCGQCLVLEFDGVFCDSVVWVNGYYFYYEVSGYLSFQVDIIDYLNFGGCNVVVVCVDVIMQEGWWYEGVGIYCYVWFMQIGLLYVVFWGNFVYIIMDGNCVDVVIDMMVCNDGYVVQVFIVEYELCDLIGCVVVWVSVFRCCVVVDVSDDVMV